MIELAEAEPLTLEDARAQIAVLERQIAAERHESQRHLRNVLATIRSLARRAVADAADAEEYQALLDGRLAAFARVQAAVVRHPAVGVELGAVIGDELLAFGIRIGESAVLEGAPCFLTARCAGLLSLLIHELSASLGPDSRLTVRWHANDGESLSIAWRANGAGPARHLDFARELIDQAIPFEVQGAGAIEIGDATTILTLTLPSACLQAR